MPTRRRSRSLGIVATSAVVHALLLTLLAVQAPRLKVPPMISGPPEAIIPVLIVPRVPPPTASPGSRPTEIRLHRRPQRFADQPLPIAPLIAPPETPKRAAPAEGPRTVAPSPTQDALAANARNALRSRLGCDDLNLTRAEREGCIDRFADGARDAPFLGLGIDSEKAKGLSAAAAQRERDYRYMRSTGALPGTTGAGPSANGNAVGRGNNLPGSTAEGIGAMVGSDRPTLKVPF